ncbi:hypothetical protein ACWD00_39290 [Streptomyces viridiviolaceus]
MRSVRGIDAGRSGGQEGFQGRHLVRVQGARQPVLVVHVVGEGTVEQFPPGGGRRDDTATAVVD